MKIALPVDEKSPDSGVCASFGRAPFFLIYDTKTKEAQYLENTAADDSGGAGIKAAQIVADSGAQVLIAPRCGQNAAKVLAAARIALFAAQPGSAGDNISAHEAGRLSPLCDIHAGYHRHAGR
jgi:predicted Fe-Mo cluster-binding NifX family protein